MSNYYQENLNSEAEDNSYDSEEGQNLGISTLDYEKIDFENKKSNKRSLEKNIEDDSSIYNKKIKIINNEKETKKDKEEEKEKEKERKEDIEEDDYLLTCPICLEHFSNKTLLNPCYHAFCYICIKKWSKVSQNCPLCKQTYDFAIYNIKDEYTFDKVYFGEMEIQSKKQKYSLPTSSRNYNKSEKDEIEYRSEIYNKGLYSKQTGKYKVLKENQTYLDYLTKNKAKFDRIIPWIERDLKAILHMDDIGIIRDFMLSIIKKYDLDSEEIREKLSVFLKTKTNHFIHELKCFINSPFNIKTYDSQNQFEKKSEHKIPLEVIKNYYLTQQKLKEKNKGKETLDK